MPHSRDPCTDMAAGPVPCMLGCAGIMLSIFGGLFLMGGIGFYCMPIQMKNNRVSDAVIEKSRG